MYLNFADYLGFNPSYLVVLHTKCRDRLLSNRPSFQKLYMFYKNVEESAKFAINVPLCRLLFISQLYRQILPTMQLVLKLWKGLNAIWSSLGKVVDPPRNIVDGFTEVVESTKVMSVDSLMLFQINIAQKESWLHKKCSHVRLYLDSFPKFSHHKKKKMAWFSCRL